MTTVNQLLVQNALIYYEAQLERSEQKYRSLYMTPPFEDWINDVLALEPKDRGKFLDPSEQVQQIFDSFVRGDKMGPDNLKKLRPIGQDIWELKPPDVRIFGFFPSKGVYVSICAEMKKKLKPNSEYKPLIKRVATERAALGFKTWVKGENLNDVL